jgi:hypothetical protein
MRKHIFSFQCVGLVAVLAGSGTVPAADPDPAVQKTFNKLLDAIQANDREAFLASATEPVKQGVTQQVMDGLNKQVGSRLKKGFESTYLCQLKQGGFQVYLWKVTFKDGGDDAVVRIALKDGRIEGFFLQ